MKWRPSAFQSDRVKLSLWDIFKLILGFEVKDEACKVGLWRWPLPLLLAAVIGLALSGCL